jgi:hypothetical protein
MAEEVFRVVLTLTIHVIDRLGQDFGACLSSARAMRVHVLHTHLHKGRIVGNNFSLADRKAALTGAHLDSVIGNSEPHCKAECPSEPIGRQAGIGVAEDGNHVARWNGTVVTHGNLAENARSDLRALSW